MALGATEKKLDHLHWPLVLCTLIICSLGVWNLASATKNAPVLMALEQPDLGTALVTFAIAMTMVMFAKVKWRDLILMLAAGVGGSVLAWRKFLKPYQKQRVLTFLDPGAYAKGAGYHSIQSVIAVGS